MRKLIAGGLGALAAGLGAPSEGAQVYKCPDADGKITYQQSPCEVNSAKGKIKVEAAAPTLAEKEPEPRIVEQCTKLHEFTSNGPADFRSRTAAYAPAYEGGWDLAVSGTVVKNGIRAQQTLRCPVAGNGAINLELWRAQSALGSIEKDKRLERAAAAGAAATTAAAAPAKDGTRIGNAEMAGERKFIGAKIKGGRLSEGQIRKTLGDPDSYGSTVGTCLLPVSRTPYACKLPTWIYLPTAQDQQTRTTITFSQDGEAIDVARAIQY